MQALVRAFPPGGDHPELALVRAGGDLIQGRLDEAAAHLAVAETYAATAPAVGAGRAAFARSGGTTARIGPHPPDVSLASFPIESRIRSASAA